MRSSAGWLLGCATDLLLPSPSAHHTTHPQARYSLHQLQYLSAIVDTSAAKATHAQSAVVKRQFEKKLKAAMVGTALLLLLLLLPLPLPLA